MQLFNSPTRYGTIAQCLHWAAVALVLVAWTLGVLGDEFPEGASRALALFVHTSAGLLIIALTVLRLLWRLLDPSPPAERTEFGEWLFADWIGLGAKLAHFALYVLLVAVPVAGIILQFARGDSLSIFGIVDIASPWVRDKAFARWREGSPRVACTWSVGRGGLACRGGSGPSLGFWRPHAGSDAARLEAVTHDAPGASADWPEERRTCRSLIP